MRQKFFALIVMSSFALVGCGSAESSQTVADDPSKSEAAASTSKSKVDKSTAQPSKPTAEPISEGAKQFVEFAGMRAEVLGVTDVVKEKELVKQFNDFCESGEPIQVTKSQELNETLEATSASTFCEMRD